MTMKQIRQTAEYKELMEILYFMRRNYKTRKSQGMYHNSDRVHDLRISYNAWKAHVVNLLRLDKTDEAKAEIQKVGAIRYTSYQRQTENIIWDLLYRFDSYFHFLQK